MTDPMTRDVSRYAPGTGWAVVRYGLLVALPTATAEQATATWEATADAHGVMEALQAVSESFGTSLAALPPFAVVVQTGRRAHVVVRGDVEVALATADGTVELHGRDVTTWVERTAEQVDGVRVVLGAGRSGAGSVASLPTIGGVLRTSAVERGAFGDVSPVLASLGALGASTAESEIDASDGADAGGSAFDRGASGGAGSDGTATGSAAWALAKGAGPAVSDAAFDGVLDGSSLDRSQLEDSSLDGAPADGAAPSTLEFGATITPEETLAPGVLDARTPDSEPDDALRSDAALDPGADPDAALHAGAGRDAEAASDDYAELWGSTILRSVEDAAMRPEDEDAHAGDAVAAAPATPMISVPQDWSVPAPPSGTPLTTTPPAATPPTPPATTPPAAPAVEQPAADGVDHDGHTVLSSSIAELQAVAAAAAATGAQGSADPGQAAPMTGPQIVARLCGQGHANPPQRERCAVCGAPVVGDARPVTRPPLGRVRVSTGQVLDLDRPVVVGRRPRSPRAGSPVGSAGADLHRIVTVPSPEQDVSRSHLEVRLEGWHVLAVDLNTTNGTMLLRSGQAPLRLHPGEPILVVSGDLVDLGDGATLSFEDVP